MGVNHDPAPIDTFAVIVLVIGDQTIKKVSDTAFVWHRAAATFSARYFCAFFLLSVLMLSRTCLPLT